MIVFLGFVREISGAADQHVGSAPALRER